MDRKVLCVCIMKTSETLNALLETLFATFQGETVDPNAIAEELGFEEYTAFMDRLYDVMGAISDFLP